MATTVLQGQPARQNTGARGRQVEHRASVSYRRFPALSAFTDEELEAITVPTESFGTTPSRRSASASPGKARFSETNDTIPFSALSSFRASVIHKGTDASRSREAYLAQQREQKAKATDKSASTYVPPFRPVNAHEARELITDQMHGYISMRSPYNEGQARERQQKLDSIAQRKAGPFYPTSAAKARTAIRVHYFLNSPDTETLEAERRFLAERASQNLDSYKTEAHAKLLLLREREKKSVEAMDEEEDGANW